MNPTDQLIADAKRYQSIHEFSQHAAVEKGIELLDHFIARVRELEAERAGLRARVEIALAKFNEADEERLCETDERRVEADKWKSEGDMYGWNFHQGVSAGCTTASILFHRVKRELIAALTGPIQSPTEATR